YFASFAFNVSLFLERIPCAKLAKHRKARGLGWFRRTALTLHWWFFFHSLLNFGRLIFLLARDADHLPDLRLAFAGHRRHRDVSRFKSRLADRLAAANQVLVTDIFVAIYKKASNRYRVVCFK